jgi:serine/threonine protein kinase
MTHLGSPHDAYDFVEQIGDGSFGTVHKAQNKISHKLVRTKKKNQVNRNTNLGVGCSQGDE